MAKPQTRETELKAAIIDADLPPRDLKVFMVLMKRATWVTATIPDKFQPRSLDELARWCHMSRANVARSLSHLQQHGWVERRRYVTENGIGGRGHPTRYQLALGRDCDCLARSSRESREDQKASQDATDKASQAETVYDEKASQDQPINRLKTVDVSAGHRPVSAKRVREEGGVKREAAVCGICETPVDPYLASLGYTTHLTCEPHSSWPEGSYGQVANRA